VFGADTPIGVLNIEGLDLAEIRSGDANWPRDHGQARGLDLYGGRDVIFDLWMKTDGTSLQQSQLELAAATVVLPNEEPPLWFQLPNLPVLCIMCRPRKRPMKIDSDYAAGQIGQPELVLHATDPRIYGAGQATTIAPNFPATSAVLDNTGNTEMRPVIVFNGPLARPKAASQAIAGEPFLQVRPNPTGVEETEETEALRREKELKEIRSKWEEESKKLEEEAEEAIEEHESVRGEKLRKEAKEARENGKLEEKGAEETARTEVEAEKAAKPAKEAEEELEEEEGTRPTVMSGDQLLLDLGTPHLVLYYEGGIESGKEPTNVSRWLTPASTWWDLIPDSNTIEFSSIDNKDTGGTATVQWAPARQL
jgi:hypothetical protein